MKPNKNQTRRSHYFQIDAIAALAGILFALFLAAACSSEQTISKEGGETLAATVDESGSDATTDTDGDGIYDFEDACPTVAPSFDVNPVDGCQDAAADTDQDDDGIEDSVDACPTIAPNIDANPVDGCEDDSDDDGVYDFEDACPSEAATTDTADGDGCEDDNSSPKSVEMCISAEDSYDFDGADGGYSEGATATRISFDGVAGVDHYVVRFKLGNVSAGSDYQYLYYLIDITADDWSADTYDTNSAEIKSGFVWTGGTGFYFCSFTDSSSTISCYFDTIVTDSLNSEWFNETDIDAHVAAASSEAEYDVISDWTYYGIIDAFGASDYYEGLRSCFEENDAPVKLDFCMSDEDSYNKVSGTSSGYSDGATATRITFDGVDGVDHYVVKVLMDDYDESNAAEADWRYLYALIDIDDDDWTAITYDWIESEIESGFTWTEISTAGYYKCSYSDAGETITCYFDTMISDNSASALGYKNNLYASIASAKSDAAHDIVSDWAYFGYIESPATLKECSN